MPASIFLSFLLLFLDFLDLRSFFDFFFFLSEELDELSELDDESSESSAVPSSMANWSAATSVSLGTLTPVEILLLLVISRDRLNAVEQILTLYVFPRTLWSRVSCGTVPRSMRSASKPRVLHTESGRNSPLSKKLSSMVSLETTCSTCRNVSCMPTPATAL